MRSRATAKRAEVRSNRPHLASVSNPATATDLSATNESHDTATTTSAPAALGASDETHPCRHCGAPISNRFAFDDCTRCAIEANKRNPEVVAWREQQRAASRERIATMKAKKEEEANE